MLSQNAVNMSRSGDIAGVESESGKGDKALGKGDKVP